MASYATRADLISRIPNDKIIELADDAFANEDLQRRIVTKFVVDTADTSGHFIDEDDNPVTVGLGNAAEKITVGARFLIGPVWYVIDAITDDGEGDNEVEFTGILGTGSYGLSLLESAETDPLVTRAIEDAEATINGKLQCKFIVPITGTIPDALRGFTVDIAVWNLYTRQPQTFPREEEDSRRLRYRDALDSLDAICEDGKGLGITPDKPEGPGRTVEGTNFDRYYEGNTDAVEYKDRTFSQKKLRGF